MDVALISAVTQSTNCVLLFLSPCMAPNVCVQGLHAECGYPARLWMKLLSQFVYSNLNQRFSLRVLQSYCLPAQAVSALCSSYVDHAVPEHFKNHCSEIMRVIDAPTALRLKENSYVVLHVSVPLLWSQHPRDFFFERSSIVTINKLVLVWSQSWMFPCSCDGTC